MINFELDVKNFLDKYTTEEILKINYNRLAYEYYQTKGINDKTSMKTWFVGLAEERYPPYPKLIKLIKKQIKTIKKMEKNIKNKKEYKINFTQEKIYKILYTKKYDEELEAGSAKEKASRKANIYAVKYTVDCWKDQENKNLRNLFSKYK